LLALKWTVWNEDVFLTENGDIPASYVGSSECIPLTTRFYTSIVGHPSPTSTMDPPQGHDKGDGNIENILHRVDTNSLVNGAGKWKMKGHIKSNS